MAADKKLQAARARGDCSSDKTALVEKRSAAFAVVPLCSLLCSFPAWSSAHLQLGRWHKGSERVQVPAWVELCGWKSGNTENHSFASIFFFSFSSFLIFLLIYSSTRGFATLSLLFL